MFCLALRFVCARSLLALHGWYAQRFQLAAVNDVTDLLPHAGLDRGRWNVVGTSLGGVPNVVVFSFMPKETLDVAVAAACITPTEASEARALTPVEAVQLGLIWRWSRQKVGMSGEGALQSQESGSSGPSFNMRCAASSAPSWIKPKEQKYLSSPDAYDRLLKNHQLAALQLRVIGRGGTPYTDFEVLTPYGRRLQGALRARAWRLQTDGSYKAVIVPGPPDFTAWAACWRVYKAALLCLGYPVGETIRLTWDTKEAQTATVRAGNTWFERKQLEPKWLKCWRGWRKQWTQRPGVKCLRLWPWVEWVCATPLAARRGKALLATRGSLAGGKSFPQSFCLAGGTHKQAFLLAWHSQRALRTSSTANGVDLCFWSCCADSVFSWPSSSCVHDMNVMLRDLVSQSRWRRAKVADVTLVSFSCDSKIEAPTGDHLKRPARSRSMSWSAGVSPSAPDACGSSRGDVATALATVHSSKDPQRTRHAISALGRKSPPFRTCSGSPRGTKTSVFLATIVPPLAQPAQSIAPSRVAPPAQVTPPFCSSCGCQRKRHPNAIRHHFQSPGVSGVAAALCIPDRGLAQRCWWQPARQLPGKSLPPHSLLCHSFCQKPQPVRTLRGDSLSMQHWQVRMVRGSGNGDDVHTEEVRIQ